MTHTSQILYMYVWCIALLNTLNRVTAEGVFHVIQCKSQGILDILNYNNVHPHMLTPQIS